jgi:hypothetical protein
MQNSSLIRIAHISERFCKSTALYQINSYVTNLDKRARAFNIIFHYGGTNVTDILNVKLINSNELE